MPEGSRTYTKALENLLGYSLDVIGAEVPQKEKDEYVTYLHSFVPSVYDRKPARIKELEAAYLRERINEPPDERQPARARAFQPFRLGAEFANLAPRAQADPREPNPAVRLPNFFPRGEFPDNGFIPGDRYEDDEGDIYEGVIDQRGQFQWLRVNANGLVAGNPGGIPEPPPPPIQQVEGGVVNWQELGQLRNRDPGRR